MVKMYKVYYLQDIKGLFHKMNNGNGQWKFSKLFFKL